MQVCYYRDKQSINKFQIAKVTASEGVSISEPFALPTKWEYKVRLQSTLLPVVFDTSLVEQWLLSTVGQPCLGPRGAGV